MSEEQIKSQKDLVEKQAQAIEAKMQQFDNVAKELSAKDGELVGSMQDIKKDLDAQLEKYKSLQEQYDALDRRISDESRSKSQIVAKTFKDRLRAKLSDNELLGRLKSLRNDVRGFSIDIDMSDMVDRSKAVGDMTSGNYTNDVVTPALQPGVKYDPERDRHVRDIISTGGTVSDTISYIAETASEGGAGMQTEGAAKAQIDFDLAETKQSIETIATFVVLSTQMMNDTPFLQSYISTRLPEKVKALEDTQLLTGNGTSPNLRGLLTSATTYAAGDFADVFALNKSQQIDALVSAINQAYIAEYRPNYLVLHPTDYHKILLLKEADGQYILPYVTTGSIPSLAGVPFFANTAMTPGSFLVGDFQMGAQLFDREAINIAFSYEDASNFRQNKVTVRAEERLGLVTYLSKAFVTGTFAAAKLALETT